MPHNLKKELAVAASVSELPFGRRRKPAEHEGTSVVSEMLLAALLFFTDEMDGFEVFKCAFGETDGRQDGLERG